MHTPTLSPIRSGAEPRARAVADATAGLLLVAFAAIVMATTIALSRFAIKTSLAPADLLALRYGIGALIFLPILLRTWSTLPAFGRRAALPLSFLHGWGMAGLALLGLQFAPAGHAAALGPGCVPLFVAAIGFVAYGRRLPRAQALGLAAIVAGAAMLLATSGTLSAGGSFLTGDVLFLLAAAVTAVYLVLVERHRLPAVASNAVVMVVSGVVVIPAYVLFADSRIPSAPWSDLAVQALFQGVLMAAAYVAVHKAVLLIGGARVAMIMAILPVLTLLAGRTIAGDAITLAESIAIACISVGIACGALWRLRGESVRERDPAA